MTKPDDGMSAPVPRMVLMPRDPLWLYVYWDLPDACVERALDALKVASNEVTRALRVHDATHLAHPATGELDLERSQDYVTVDITSKDDHWYLKVGAAEHAYCVEYLLLTADGRKASLVTSNVAETPAASVAAADAETWVDAERQPAPAPTDEPASVWADTPDNLHEALSSAGSGSVTQPAPDAM
jgi:hypothetical protein